MSHEALADDNVPPTAPTTKAQPPPDAASSSVRGFEAQLQQAMAGGAGLTAADVARKATAVSPEIQAKALGVEAADAKLDQTHAQFLPKVTTQGRYTRLSPLDPPRIGGGQGSLVGTPAPPGTIAPNPIVALAPFSFPIFLDQYQATAGIVVPVSDYLLRMAQAFAAAKGSKRAAEWEREATRYQVDANSRLAYYDWVRAIAQKFVAQQAWEQAKGHKADAQRAFDVGLVSRADVLRSESAVKGAELLLSRTSMAQNIMEERLRVLMHDAPETTYAVGENILEHLPPLAEKQNLSGLVRESLENRLEVKALVEAEGALDKSAWVQKAGIFPRLDLAANGQYANPNQRLVPNEDKFVGTWDASVVLSWSPTDALVAGAGGSETEAKRRQVAAQRTALLDGLRMEVSQAYEGLKVAEAAIDTTLAALVASEESYRVRRDMYRNGRSTSIEVTDAETDLTKARFDAVNARIDHRQARVRLSHALGRDVANGRR
jgi:outer membrane protein TolC